MKMNIFKRRASGPMFWAAWLRFLLFCLVFSLGIMSVVGSGGGGGGGGSDNGGTDEPAPPFPSVVQYTAGSPVDFNGSGVSFELEGGGTINAGFFLEGRYAKNTRTYTLTAHNVPRINLTTSDLPYTLMFELETFGIQIEQPLQWVRGEQLTSGQFRCVSGDSVRVTVTANAGDTGQPGVDIETYFTSTSLTWAEFNEVLNDHTEYDSYIVTAAFGYRVFQQVFDQIQLGMDGIEFVTINDTALSEAGSGVGIDHTCDLFPYNNQSGNMLFIWYDGPGEHSEALGAGDSFEAVYNDCWTDEPGVTSVWVQSGEADFNIYWEDPKTIVLGFESVILNDIVETPTMEQGGIYSLGETFTVNSFNDIDVDAENGFHLRTEPDTSSGINLTNAVEIASMGFEALRLPPQVGNVPIELLAGIVSDPSFVLCDIDGSVSVSPTPSSTTAVPESFDVEFNACQMDPADPVAINGTLSLHVDSVTGGTLAAITGDDYTASLTVDSINLTSTDDVGTVTLTGGSRFSRTAVSGDFTELSESVAGGLTSSENGITRTLQAYQVVSVMTAGDQYGYGESGNVVVINSNEPEGTFTVTVIQPIEGSDDSPPVSGELRIEAFDGSTLTMTINNGTVTMALDSDGDGSVDDTVDRNWDDIY